MLAAELDRRDLSHQVRAREAEVPLDEATQHIGSPRDDWPAQGLDEYLKNALEKM